MATIDVFNHDAFRLQSMLPFVEAVPYKPQRLGEMGVFTPAPVRSALVNIEYRLGKLHLIKTSPRGAPLEQRITEKRELRSFSTLRIAKGDRILASELADIRAFGAETEVMQVQAEVARRLAGPTGLMADIEMTLENMRLGCIQGKVVDADGALIYDWFKEWGITISPTAEFAFDLANKGDGEVREMCGKVIRAMMVNAKGVWRPDTRCVGLCDQEFWDALIKNREVRETYLNHQSAADLRTNASYGSFEYGGIHWEIYRGQDDLVSMQIPTGTAKFFPVNAPGAFLEVFSPGESFDYINQPGSRIYPMIVPDRDRNFYVDLEAYSYPLHICTRPLMLQSARVGT